MKEIQPPHAWSHEEPSIFLAGSIEMDTAERWQEHVIALLKDVDVTILNPRRNEWDRFISQSAEDPRFFEQVNWELNALEQSTHILFYFAPNTKSPISLLELGLFAKSGKVIVVCPDGFWRKGNVEVICARYAVEQVPTLEEAVLRLRERLAK